MNRFRVLAYAFLMSGGTAVAQDQFSELTNPSGFDQPAYGRATPHADPVRLNYTGTRGPGTLHTGIVEFANTPAPYVYVNVAASGPGASAGLAAELRYSFQVSGPASSFVPLIFTANFNLGHGSFFGTTGVELVVSSGAADFSASQSARGSVLCQSAGIGRCDGSSSAGSMSVATVNVAGFSTYVGGSAYGTITGTLLAPTGATGQSLGLVQMRAAASDGEGLGQFDSWAFIDPKFEVDASYLALNPTAAFLPLSGVGNELAMMPVPEPGSALLLTGGMLALSISALRRRARSEVE